MLKDLIRKSSIYLNQILYSGKIRISWGWRELMYFVSFEDLWNMHLMNFDFGI
jgi:hypothetical protein